MYVNEIETSVPVHPCPVHVQIILKIIAFRLKYFTHKFEVFDGMVVVVSWVLDIASM